MKMVSHQAVVIEPEAKLLSVALYQVQESGTILIIGENNLAVVASVHEVVAGFLGPLTTAWRARHGQLRVHGMAELLLDQYIHNQMCSKGFRSASPFASMSFPVASCSAN